MDAHTLQALRTLLFFSVPEAAQYVADVSERAWRRWEDGSRVVPDDVAQTMTELAAWRAGAIARLEAEMGAAEGPVRVPYYPSVDDWQGEPRHWRPACSAAAEIIARHGPRASLAAPRGAARAS